MSVFFNGRLLISPVTASVVDDSAMYNPNPNVGNVLGIIGKSQGGKPASIMRFGGAAQARDTLIDGEGLRAVERAFDPSSQTVGPSEVVFVRVNPATQAALVLKDASAANVINLVSQDYGIYTNNVKIKIEAGSVSGKKITTQISNAYNTGDNLKRNAILVSYSGTSAVATIAVTNTAVTLTLDGGPTAIDLAVYTTIGAVADRINNVTGFTAVVQDGNTEKVALLGLDTLATQNVKITPYTLTANLQACIDWINSAMEGYVTATRATNAGAVPVNIPFTYLTGAVDGSVTTVEWQAAFDELQTADVQWVVPVSPIPAIHAMASAHVGFMSNVSRMERRAICGGDVAATDTDAIAAAKLLNDDRTSYTHLGFYDYNAAGDLTLYPPYILAGLLGGMISGVNPGTPLTNKALKVRGIERRLRNPVDTDQLILGGVLAVEDTKQGFKCVKSISTWLINSNFNRVEMSTGAAVDYVSRSIRNALDPLRGSKASPLLLSEAVSRAETCLLELARPEPMGISVIVGDRLNPAFKNITASIAGDVLRVEFECSPVIPCNYILIAIHARPWSGTATAFSAA